MQHDGDPAEGIRILRNGYEEDRLASNRRHGTLRDDFPYLIDDVRARMDVRDGRADLTLTVEVDIRNPVPDWGMGMSIDTPLGTRLYEATTWDTNVSLPNVKGKHVLTMTFPDVRIGTGKYLVNVGLGDRTGRNFDQAPAAVSFDTRPGRDRPRHPAPVADRHRRVVATHFLRACSRDPARTLPGRRCRPASTGDSSPISSPGMPG